jgi:hypothetical protein
MIERILFDCDSPGGESYARRIARLCDAHDTSLDALVDTNDLKSAWQDHHTPRVLQSDD